MRVLTWNLWWRNGPWRRREAAIASVLAENVPDVCGLQEVWATDGQNLAAALADRLGMHWCWAAVAGVRQHDGETAYLGNAILSRWPIITHTHAALPTDEPESNRVALHALIDAPDAVLPMFTAHLTYQPGGSHIRMAQVRRLAEFIAEQEATSAASGRDRDAYPPVVTGDFNAEPDSDELRLLGGLLTVPAVPDLVLLDSWRYADPRDPGFTWDRRNSYLAGSVIPDSRIDYILVGLPRQGRGAVRSARLAGSSPVDKVWPSDHFAVVADLQRNTRCTVQG